VKRLAAYTDVHIEAQRALAALADRWAGALQPAAEVLGPRLGVSRDAVAMFSEEARAPL